MIDANKGVTEDTLRRLKEASYERFRIELIKSIEHLLVEFEMDWDDAAEKLQWVDLEGKPISGDAVRLEMGTIPITVKEINDIAHLFSMEPYILFRPRFPYTQS